MLLAWLALSATQAAPLYEAFGTEPFWGLIITRRTMILDDQSAEQKITAPTPRPAITRLGMTYSAPRMTVKIIHEGCNDGMSEGVYADTVEVSGEDYQFSGCGGPEVKPNHIAGSSWDIYSVDGETMPYEPEPPTGQRSKFFAVHWQLNGTIHANLGCDMLVGRYRAAHGQIVPKGRLVPTGGTCPHQALEAQLAAILSAPVTLRWFKDDEAEVANKRGTIRLRRRY